jgi:hypothetical protein
LVPNDSFAQETLIPLGGSNESIDMNDLRVPFGSRITKGTSMSDIG